MSTAVIIESPKNHLEITRAELSVYDNAEVFMWELCVWIGAVGQTARVDIDPTKCKVIVPAVHTRFFHLAASWFTQEQVKQLYDTVYNQRCKNLAETAAQTALMEKYADEYKQLMEKELCKIKGP